MEDPADDSQPAGFYPRVNAKALATGQHMNMIVSVVGHFLTAPNADGSVPFKASDGGIITVTPEQFEMPLIGPDSPPFEIVGQAMEAGRLALFVARELTKDMDLEVYDAMLNVQTNPKFASYFSPVPAGHP